MSYSSSSITSRLTQLSFIACIGLTLAQSGWKEGRATFYGNEWWLWDIHQGSCGYGYLCPEEGTGWDITALPDVHPRYAASCGRCYEVKCRPSTFNDNYGVQLDRTQQWNTCIDPSASVVVTVTDTCPCYYAENFYSNQRWCCGDMDHFDLSVWAFEKLADMKWGVIGMSYREVPCDHVPHKPAQPPASPFTAAPMHEGVSCPRGNFPLRQQIMNRNSIRDKILINAGSGIVTAFAASSDLVYSETPDVVLNELDDQFSMDNAEKFLNVLANEYDKVDEEKKDDPDQVVKLNIVHDDEQEDSSQQEEQEQQEDDDEVVARSALSAARSVFVGHMDSLHNIDESATITLQTGDTSSEHSGEDSTFDLSEVARNNYEQELSTKQHLENSQGEEYLFQDGSVGGWEVLTFSAESWEAPGAGVNGGTALCGKLYNGGMIQVYGQEGHLANKHALEFWVATDQGIPNVEVNVGKDGMACQAYALQSLSQSGQLGAYSRFEINKDMFQYDDQWTQTCDFGQARSVIIKNQANHDTWICVDEIKLLG
eukprot:TRINITY_DN11455_c0_g1_i1.p1 TRINITY_DN11455_c0_g1~~TRINITY_DN11455_c0_g1_i1.p1  ORF type:complete len:540 (+),score=63.16 TRINITY_DN11455_c0_g1_i1:199-1818(+)